MNKSNNNKKKGRNCEISVDEEMTVQAIVENDQQQTNQSAAAAKEQNCWTKGVKMVYAAVHPSLEQLPCKSACFIAAVVITIQALFAIFLTLYHWTHVRTKLAVIDAEWTIDGPNNPYLSQFKSPLHICNSLGPKVDNETGGTFYDEPCLLTGLTCEENYGHRFCPSTEYPFECFKDLPNCGDLDSFASVVYVEGDAFSVALGSALGYLVYVQAVALTTCYLVYYGCCKRVSASELGAVLRAATSSIGKK